MTPDEVRRAALDGLPEGRVVVALSGGADSATLAWALSGRAQTRAVTVDHGLPASARLVDAARRIATLLGLDHEVVTIVPGGSSETALRQARLAALEAATTPDEWIATGHTADDQAETVLGNLLRGAGSGGLAGIPRVRGRFIRPLLAVTRADTRALAATLDLPFLDDPQNDDLEIRRNRLRHVTLPVLAYDYNPALRQALVRTARLAAADDETLEERAAAVPLVRDEEAVFVPAGALRTLPEAVASRVVRRALRLIDGPHAGMARSVEAVLAAVDGRTRTLPGELTARREGPFVVVHGTPPDPPDPITIEPPGEARFGPWRITVGGRGVAVPLADAPLRVRAARPGDRIALREGAKKVTDALREAGVAPRLRARWPVVEQHGRIAWVVGVRVAAAREGEHRMPVAAAKGSE